MPWASRGAGGGPEVGVEVAIGTGVGVGRGNTADVATVVGVGVIVASGGVDMLVGDDDTGMESLCKGVTVAKNTPTRGGHQAGS